MPKSKKKISDPVFGELKFDVLWCGHINIAPYNDLELSVDGSIERPPTDRQREVFLQFRSLFPAFKEQIDLGILQYYLEDRKKFLDMAVDPEVDVPDIKTVAELDKVIESSPLLFIDGEYGEDVPIEMSWDVTFDDEHGVTVRIEDFQIVDIGPG